MDALFILDIFNQSSPTVISNTATTRFFAQSLVLISPQIRGIFIGLCSLTDIFSISFHLFDFIIMDSIGQRMAEVVR